MLRAISQQIRKQIGGTRKRIRTLSRVRSSEASNGADDDRLARVQEQVREKDRELMRTIDERKRAQEEVRKRVNALQYTIGERERMKALWELVGERLNNGNAEFMAKLMRSLQSTPSERFQDLFALLLTGKQRDGFFVEFGACDGIAASNTYLLEKKFSWTGILAEPATIWHDALEANRSARIDRRCVSSSTGQVLEFHEGEMAGVSALNSKHAHMGNVAKSYKVRTVSLNDLLAEHKAPGHIDFMSVDCEGHELEALRTLDFSKYSFGFICVEQHEPLLPDNDVSTLLENAGYKKIFPRHVDKTRPPAMQVTAVDVFFVPD